MKLKNILILVTFLILIISMGNKISFEKVIGDNDEQEDMIASETETNEGTETMKRGKIKVGNALYIRIFKKEQQLELWLKSNNGKYELYKTFDICTFSGGLGPKKREGDRKTPEGFYSTKKSFLNPNSSYHLSFNIGYPNEYDKSHGYTGSLIMVHGACVSIGCYAMTDEYIEEIYEVLEKALQGGQRVIDVHAFPFRMTKENMKRYENSEYYDFWTELKPGYDFFEENKIPPKVKVENKKYKIVK